MHVELTTDVNVVKPVFKALEDVISDDNGPKVDDVDFKDLLSTGVFFSVLKHREVVGIVYFHEIAPNEWQGHMNMLPKGRGRTASDAFKEALRRLKSLVTVEKIIAQVPLCFTNVMSFVLSTGAKLVGATNDTWVYKGESYPVFKYELEIK